MTTLNNKNIICIVTKHKQDKHGHWIGIYKCYCGNQFETLNTLIRTKRTKSCGCYKMEILTKRSTKHGKGYLPEYKIWQTMKARCLNKNSKKFHYYGGRGITICPEWAIDFQAFYNDMGPRPDSKYSIDRIDNNKGYYKENCRWVLHKDQMNNQRRNNLIEFKGEIKTLYVWEGI